MLLYLPNVHSAAGIWSEVIPTGEGPSARFAVAGDCLDPHIGGTLVFIGGCDKNLKALEDMHFLHTGLSSNPPTNTHYFPLTFTYFGYTIYFELSRYPFDKYLNLVLYSHD